MPFAPSTPLTLSANSGELRPVSALLEESLRRVEDAFDRALHSDLPPIQRLVRHLETYRGKMLRPALVVLSALAGRAQPNKPGDSAISDELLAIAAVCEMVHMATLVHDDVLDEADVRRKGATVNRLNGNEAAVILGDYLFSSAYRLCATLKSREAAVLIGETGMTLCAGELLQLNHRDNFSIDEATYFEVVRRKTGSLIGTACRLGAAQGGATAEVAERFGQLGMDVGVAFQIQDDLLDLTGDAEEVGKPLRRDVEMGKLTIPIIHHLAVADPGMRGRTLLVLESKRPVSGATARHLAHALEATGSLAHARERAAGLVERAKGQLRGVPDSPARALLMVMADQVISRTA